MSEACAPWCARARARRAVVALTSCSDRLAGFPAGAAAPGTMSTTTTVITHPDGTTVTVTTTDADSAGGELKPVAASDNGLLTFEFSVRGQSGKIPKVGLGTATLFDQQCTNTVRTAIRAGYRMIDTALLYNNQKAVGEGIRQAIAAGEVTREELWVTSKVGFFPGDADGTNTWVPIVWTASNCKGKQSTLQAIDECLELLGLEYVDLMLIHNPAAELTEYRASGAAHFFGAWRCAFATSRLPSFPPVFLLRRRCFRRAELFHDPHDPTQPDYSEAERTACLEARKELAWAAKTDGATERQGRADTWAALEQAHAAGKCKFIGVSNYPPALLREMEGYATQCMPCINQLELHPRFSSPSLRSYAEETGLVLTGYGTGNSVCRLEACSFAV